VYGTRRRIQQRCRALLGRPGPCMEMLKDDVREKREGALARFVLCPERRFPTTYTEHLQGWPRLSAGKLKGANPRQPALFVLSVPTVCSACLYCTPYATSAVLDNSAQYLYLVQRSTTKGPIGQWLVEWQSQLCKALQIIHRFRAACNAN